ncbi:MAG: YkgJ family cysteine cluster protein [Desulfobacterales bacterium]|nr:YkgJ family cysteine cluster protein [Desulfobacterales bacterium]
MMHHVNPCLRCGACCAYYRASFYWAESNDLSGVPPDLTEKLNDFYVVMKGTHSPRPRCIALEGQIGIAVCCSIYEHRASVCRNFTPSWESGIPNERCDKARAAWNLKPLAPATWYQPDCLDKAA